MKPLCVLASLCFCISFSQARTIILSSNSFTKTFHEAVSAAKDFDTVLIRSGVYSCVNETINKSLTIIGENFPALDGQLQDEVLVVMSDNVNINGIEIRNSKCGSMKDFSGLRVFKSRNVKIENCTLNNTYFGIYLSDSKYVLVKNCKSKGANYGMSDTGNGIHLWKCDSITIEDNHLEGHRDGIYLEFAKHCFMQNNLCEKNFRYGLHFMFSDNDTYENNTFTNNGTGVAVMYSKGVHMFNNKFENNWGDASYGLLLKDMTNGIIRGNTFENNTVGVTMEGGTNMRFEKNNFLKNGYAMKIMANCRLDTFVRNNFSGNTFDASTNGELKENLFENNYWDKYEGYDLNHDKVGDIPYRPVSLYSVLVEQMPYAVMLMRSFTIDLLNRAEKNIPSIVPETFVDDKPLNENDFAEMIRTENLEKHFGKLHVLRGVNTSFSGGEVVSVIGPNGSGKTTLIKSILGMVVADKGKIYFDNKDVANDFTYRHHIGYMPQIGRYPENMKMGQLFSMMKDLRKSSSALDEELLNEFKLAYMFDKPMRTLSGGTTQKVSAALAFLFNPKVLILDEPTAGLDPVASEILKAKVLKAKKEGKLVIVTSHIMSEVEEMADKIMYLFEGKINFYKTIADLKSETGEEKLGKAIAKITTQQAHA